MYGFMNLIKVHYPLIESQMPHYLYFIVKAFDSVFGFEKVFLDEGFHGIALECILSCGVVNLRSVN